MPLENLRYSIDVYDAGDNLVETLGRVADFDVAVTAFWQCVRKRPGERLFLRDKARVVRRFDEPKEDRPVPVASIDEMRRALARFTFPADPKGFGSQDGGCTSALIVDEDVQLARRLTGFKA